MSQNSKYNRKSHNVTVLLYHIVSSAKYRRVVFTEEVDQVLIDVCHEIEKRYERLPRKFIFLRLALIITMSIFWFRAC